MLDFNHRTAAGQVTLTQACYWFRADQRNPII
jgi:hypothetical protein